MLLKNVNNEKSASKLLFFNKEKIEKRSDIFDVENHSTITFGYVNF